jgi:hypothetical protein
MLFSLIENAFEVLFDLALDAGWHRFNRALRTKESRKHHALPA